MNAYLAVSFLDVPELALSGKIEPTYGGERNVWAIGDVSVPGEAGWIRLSLPSDDSHFWPYLDGLVAITPIPLDRVAVEVLNHGTWHQSDLAGALLICASNVIDVLRALGDEK